MDPRSDERTRGEAPLPLRLSASAVRDYLACPYRYAASHLVPLPPSERRQITQLRFGEAVHQALADFVTHGGWERLGRADLIALLDARWPAAVYADAGTAAANRERAVAMLTRFYENPYPQSVARELAVERRLTWTRFHRGMLATGKVDRAVVLEDGTLEIIDYKTGARRLGREQLLEDVGALFYRSLAADKFAALAPQDIRVTYYYLATGIPVGVVFDRETFAAGWSRIERTAARIRRAMGAVIEGVPVLAAFPPARNEHCRLCPLGDHCSRLEAAGALKGLDSGFGGRPT